MPKSNEEYRDYSISYLEADGKTQAKWYGNYETLVRENPGIKILEKKKLRAGWRTKTEV